jgi:hypothetical protein
MPDIILVAQEQDVGLATHQCIGEIAHIAEIARVLDDLDPDAQRLRTRHEGLQQLQRLVAGTVIADHDFVHRKILVEDAVQLRLQVARTVVGAQRDANALGRGRSGWRVRHRTYSRKQGPGMVAEPRQRMDTGRQPLPGCAAIRCTAWAALIGRHVSASGWNGRGCTSSACSGPLSAIRSCCRRDTGPRARQHRRQAAAVRARQRQRQCRLCQTGVHAAEHRVIGQALATADFQHPCRRCTGGDAGHHGAGDIVGMHRLAQASTSGIGNRRRRSARCTIGVMLRSMPAP